jgi:hypothetical protein
MYTPPMGQILYGQITAGEKSVRLSSFSRKMRNYWLKYCLLSNTRDMIKQYV